MKNINFVGLFVSVAALSFGPLTPDVHAQYCQGDLNLDGVADGADLAMLLGNWGQCQVAPSWATVLEWAPDASIVTDATLRDAITASGFPWRVRDNASNVEMVLIPAGNFTMGCSPSVSNPCSSDEVTHQVTLTKAFYIGRYEVTQAQWLAEMGSNPSYFKPPLHTFDTNRPVENISWNTIQPFCTQNGLRLPTEAEWEYAYRAGTTTAFHSSSGYPSGTNDDTLLGAIAWYSSNSVVPTYGSVTHAVGGKAANKFGVYDMAGNVEEWCQDWWGAYGSASVTDPQGTSFGFVRAIRGGSFGVGGGNNCRSSRRNPATPDEATNAHGFRVAKTPIAVQCQGDINLDHNVDGADLAILLGKWGACQGPSWGTVLEWVPDAAVVTNVGMRNAIVATGMPWRVRDNSSNVELLQVPPGTFMMGCSPSNAFTCQAGSVEAPHQITLSKAFYIGRYEVTQAQWLATMGSNPSHFTLANGYPGSMDRPVEMISWNMTQDFTAATGLRLPTEAEWEYAYRAGTTTAFHSFPGYPNGTNDDTLLGNIAWYVDNAGVQTHVVGSAFANGLGLSDMSGNLWEWCQDWYQSSYYGASPLTDPPGPTTGTTRVSRGGGLLYNSYNCRSSRRIDYPPAAAEYTFGFRAARNP